jgi:hypothetical protein
LLKLTLSDISTADVHIMAQFFIISIT